MQVIASTRPNRPYILGVAGGSGSGKTFFAESIRKALGAKQCQIIYQDNFYHDQSQRFDFDGGSVNFDHPDSIDFALLEGCLRKLKIGSATSIPIYDFVTHSRKKETIHIEPSPVILVDGILIFHPQSLRDLFDELVFFDTAEDLRFQRRLQRDVQERGRSSEGVRNQFYNQVKPMHDQFVDPTKLFAGSVINDTGDFSAILEGFCQKLRNRILS